MSCAKKSISGSASDKKGHLKNLPQKGFKLHTFNFLLGGHEALTIKETIILDVSCPHSLILITHLALYNK